MDFAFTPEQREIGEAARRYLADAYPPERVAHLADAGGTDPDAWPELRRQGWLDPSLSPVVLGLLAEESGYALHPTPWLTTVAVGGSEHPVTLATRDAEETTAVHSGAGWRLDGVKDLVPDARTATALVVTARTPDGPALFTVDAFADGVTRTEVLTVDRLRPLGRLRFIGAPARLCDDQTPRRHRLLALLSCEAVGVARRALDVGVAHANTRTQFGRPIGVFQAVAHRLADAYTEIELAKSLAYRAAWLISADAATEADLATAVLATRRAALTACAAAMQTLGGTAMTWEHPLHWWYRRALWWQAFDTSDAAHRETLASTVLAAA